MSTDQIQEVLDFWFAAKELNEPNIDSRMSCWFDDDIAFNAELTERFTCLTEQALSNDLDSWAETPAGRLALIILLEQFPRHIHKDGKKAFQGDIKALKLCEQGVASDAYRKLTAIEQMFFFMPLQRAESIKVQQTSVKVFNSLASRVSETMRDTFETVAQFAELRHDIIVSFGRFPHRNASLGRSSSSKEDEVL
ncbi:MAG: DUF924 domain-containing protein [Gammaproteobacteria bacterium]|nr:DUF924 domain-containing protein [Gammaproteobacteria bacterium]MCP4091722.1 DUF924 domain-containing protein [Gammaproteobacteria bacterium]MCP4275029.1 DUF924 domain-containing protein [Gammaproteobacteria bacterium]MCP4831852.1 DUF924 domain-containing protein [Gammaproteobacteria bacterium]MCP4929788.1 DUF924 domain-containing protein [Gammaproteobacteria bacterium]